MSVSLSLAGKVAIVTGASRGIGEAIARCFVEQGARVVIASRKEEGVRAVAQKLDPKGEKAVPIAAHTGKEDDCRALVAQAVQKLGKVDILVNNAGTNPYFGPMLDTEMPAWDKTFEVNLKGYFWMIRESVKNLRARTTPGANLAVVNVASVAGLMATPAQGCYGMTKAAVVSMTKTLAVELAGSNVRVNAIAPGFVDTRLAGAILKNDALLDIVLQKTPMKRYAKPDEIAGGALYLASESASFLTGHTLVIDGGMTIG
jgi:NAD(P)-dependent dehydrogenase (short-subunit alcohol dehydrogenase family)